MSLINRITRPRLSMPSLLLLVAVYLASTQNFSFWREVLASLPATRSLHEWVFVATLYLVLVCALLACLVILTPWRLIKPMLMLFVLIAAVCSHFMDSFRTVIDEAMVINTLQTDAREASELLVPAFWWHVLLQGLLPALLIARVRLAPLTIRRELLQRLAVLALSLATLAGCLGARYKDFSLWARENRPLRTYLNPSYPINSAYRVASQGLRPRERVAISVIGGDATRPAQPSAHPLLVILVVGETARAANFQLEGYERPTNPELAAVPGLMRFSPASSCGTSTAISVPCLFSDLGRHGFDKYRARGEENLLDVLKRVGVGTLWLDNNSGCKGVCARTGFTDLSASDDPVLCRPDGCYDEILLQNLEQQLKTLHEDHLVVLHQKGSHGPSYYRRYPPAFRRFVPDCAQDAVQTCSRDQIVNAYDNTILYTDHVLASLIARMQGRAASFDSVVLYVSDHGESLGEDGIYLHGLPYALAPDFQKRVPFLAWFSPAAAARRGIDPACVDVHREPPVSHDNVFDTVLGLFQVHTAIYEPELDLFGTCTAPSS